MERCQPDPHDARHNRRQQGVRLACRQNKHGVGRRLLQRLEQGVGGRFRSLLRYQALGVADDEDLARSHRWCQRQASQQQPHRSDPVARKAGRGLVQRLIAAHCHLLDERRFDQVDLFIGVRALLAHLDRHEPVEVGVLEREREAAAATLTARLPLFFSPALAQDELAEPQRQPLFPDPARTLEQESLRQPAGGDSPRQPLAEPLMAVQGVQRHGGIYRLVWYRTGTLGRNTLIHSVLPLRHRPLRHAKPISLKSLRRKVSAQSLNSAGFV